MYDCSPCPRPTCCVQSRFRKLSCTAVGGADAKRFSIGAEEVNYEGPLQLRLQVKLPDIVAHSTNHD
jgi:hypothetical protein